jgi:hypothetical protein
MEQKPLKLAFTAPMAMVGVLDVGLILQGENTQNKDNSPFYPPHNNRIIDLAMTLYVKYIEMREWLATNGKGEEIAEEELVIFFPGHLFAVMQQHPKWEWTSWFQGNLFGTPVEMHRVPEDMSVYWGYRGDDMITVIGRISCLNAFF